MPEAVIPRGNASAPPVRPQAGCPRCHCATISLPAICLFPRYPDTCLLPRHCARDDPSGSNFSGIEARLVIFRLCLSAQPKISTVRSFAARVARVILPDILSAAIFRAILRLDLRGRWRVFGVRFIRWFWIYHQTIRLNNHVGLYEGLEHKVKNHRKIFTGDKEDHQFHSGLSVKFPFSGIQKIYLFAQSYPVIELSVSSKCSIRRGIVIRCTPVEAHFEFVRVP